MDGQTYGKVSDGTTGLFCSRTCRFFQSGIAQRGEITYLDITRNVAQPGSALAWGALGGLGSVTTC